MENISGNIREIIRGHIRENISENIGENISETVVRMRANKDELQSPLHMRERPRAKRVQFRKLLFRKELHIEEIYQFHQI